MHLILDTLEQKVLEEENLEIRFSWPEDLNWDEPTILASPVQKLTEEQDQRLRDWMQKHLGMQHPSFWDRIRRDSGV